MDKFRYGEDITIFNVDDIKRLRKIFGLTQKDLADDLNMNRSYVGQVESGRKLLSDNFKDTLGDYFTNLSKIRLQNIEEMKKENDEKRDKYISSLASLEKRKAIALDIIAQRKSSFFSPSIVPSIDMIWLQSVIDGNKKRVLFESLIHSTEPNIEVKHDYPKQIEKDCEYLISIQCVDVHITVKFGFKTKDSGGQITNKLVVQFNPNKADFENNKYLHLLFYLLGSNPKCRKFDVCKDYVGVPMDTVSVSNTQRKGIYQYVSKGEGVTHYLGDINSNGIRVYDKRAEIKAKDSVVINDERVVKDIGYECIRYEHRRTMPRATELSNIVNELEGINLPVLSSYDCMSLLCSTEDENSKSKIEISVYATSVMILEGRMSITQLKSSNRKLYNRVMEYMESIKLANLSLSDIEIVQALSIFVSKYLDTYEIGYKAFNEEVQSLNKQYMRVSNESIDRATDMLCNIIDGNIEKVEVKPMTKEEQKEQLRKSAEKNKSKNIMYIQNTFVDKIDDTKYF